eukprot:6183155-Pleurochrysis_carterae.AAC.1
MLQLITARPNTRRYEYLPVHIFLVNIEVDGCELNEAHAVPFMRQCCEARERQRFPRVFDFGRHAERCHGRHWYCVVFSMNVHPHKKNRGCWRCSSSRGQASH